MAGKTSEIRTKFTLTGEQKYIDALKGIAKEQTNLSTELKSYDKQLKSLGNSQADQEKRTEILKKKTEALAKQYDLQQKRIAELNGAMETAKKQYGENSDEVQKYQRQIHTAEGYLAQFGKELKDSAKALGEQESKLHKLSEAAANFGQKMQDTGQKMTKGVTVPIAGIAAASMAAWSEVDDALDGIITATGATGDALEDLHAVFKDVYGSMPVEADKVSAAVGELNTQFGLTGKSLEGATRSILEFAEINDADVKGSVQGTKGAIQAFGLSAEDLGRVLDTVNVTGQNTGVSVDKLFGTISKNAGVLKSLNFTFEESATLIGQIEQSGLDSSKTLSYLSRAAVTLQKDGKDLKTELLLLAKAMEEGADKQELMTKAAELFGTKGAQYMTDAIERGALDFSKLATAAEDAAGSVSNTFNATLDPIDNWKIALNNLKLAGAELGEEVQIALAPILESLTATIQDLTKWFAGLDDRTKQIIITVGGLAAAIGPALIIVGKISQGVSVLTGWLDKLTGAMGAKGLLGVLSGPAGLVALAGTLAVVIGTKVYKSFTSVTPEVKKLREEIEGTNKALDEAIDGHDTAAAEAKSLADTLFSLAEAEGKTNSQKEHMADLVAALNEQMPGLNLSYDKQTDALNLTNDAVREYIGLKKDEADSVAYEEAHAEKRKQQVEILKELARVEKELSEAKKRQIDEAMESGEAYGSETAGIAELMRSYDELKDKYETNAAELEEYDAKAKSAAESVDELSESQDGAAESTKDLGDAHVEAAYKLQAFKEANAEVYESLSEDEQAFIDAAIAGMDDLSEVTIEGLHEMYEARQAAQEEELKSYQEHLAAMTGATIQQKEQTAEEMLASLEQNAATYEAYYANRLTIQQRLQGEEFTALREHLLSLGAENTNLLDEMANMSEEELKRYSEAFNSAGDAAKNYASTNTREAVAAVSEAIQEGVGQVEIDADELNSAIIAAFNDLGGELDLTTKEGIAALAQAIVDSTTLPESKAEALADAVAEALGKATDDGESKGQEIATKYGVGIKDKTDEASDAAGKLKDETVKALDDEGEAKKQAGKTTDEYINTFKDKTPDAKSAGAGLGKGSVDGMAEALEGKGSALANNFADSAISTLRSRIPDMRAAATELGNAAPAGTRKSWQIASPSKVAMRDSKMYVEGLLKPLKAGVREMYSASRKLGEAGSKGYTDATTDSTQTGPVAAAPISKGGDTINVNIAGLPPGMSPADGRALGRTIAQEIKRQKYAKGDKI